MSWKIGSNQNLKTIQFAMPDRVVDGKTVAGGQMTVAYDSALLANGQEQEPKIVVSTAKADDGATVYLRWQRESKRRR